MAGLRQGDPGSVPGQAEPRGAGDAEGGHGSDRRHRRIGARDLGCLSLRNGGRLQPHREAAGFGKAPGTQRASRPLPTRMNELRKCLSRRWMAWLVSAALAPSSACSSGSISKPTSSRPSPTPHAISTSTPTPLPPCRDASSKPQTPSGPATSGQLWTVTSGLNQPDDLLFANGSLLIGVLGAGKVAVLAPAKPLTELPIQIPAAEGMVYIG